MAKRGNDARPPATSATTATRATSENPAETKPLTGGFIRSQRQAWDDGGGPIDWARQFIDQMCTSRQGEAGLPFLSNPLSLESLLLHYAARTELAEAGFISEPLGNAIGLWAATDHCTDSMARALVRVAACEGPPLPAALHAFASKVASGAQPPKKRGNWEWRLANRNRVGMAVLLVLTSPEGFRLNPTRNVVGGSLSACDVLAEAASGLGWASITSNAADEIWRNRARMSLEWELCLLLKALTDHRAGQIPTDVALRALDALALTPSGRKARKEPDA